MEDKLDTVIKRVSKRGTIKYKWIVEIDYSVCFVLNDLSKKVFLVITHEGNISAYFVRRNFKKIVF